MATQIRPGKKASSEGERSTRAGGPGAEILLESPAFTTGEGIPVQHTADGQNLSPALTWGDLPREVRSLALLCEDPDAPSSSPFVHWLIADITAQQAGTGLPQGLSRRGRVPEIPGAVQGENSFGGIGYGGPHPPRGHGIHHYHFRLYALDALLGLREGFSKEDLLTAMKGHLVGNGELVGTYSR